MSNSADQMQGRRMSSKTRLYDILGVDKNATDADLKAAYRKRSLLTHPDKKGGDTKAFIDVKYAYDVLHDPTMRYINNMFGDVGVQVYSNGIGTMGNNEAISIFCSLDQWDRTVIVMAVIVCLGYLLCFPILLSIRWDYPKSMHFAHVFIPVWLGLSAILVCCVRSIVVLDVDESESPDLERQKLRCASICGSLVVMLFFAMLVLLVLRLDGHTDWSYMWVIWPWIVLELVSAGNAMAKHDESYEPSRLERAVTIVAAICPHIFNIIFVIHIAWKLDGMPISWWRVFWPIWVSIAVLVALQCLRCVFIQPESPTPDDKEADPNMERRISIRDGIISQILWLGIALLLCYKLSHPKAFPAFVIFLPLFLTAGCVCCLTTCIVCCGPRDIRDIDEYNGYGENAMPPPRGTTYNTV